MAMQQDDKCLLASMALKTEMSSVSSMPNPSAGRGPRIERRHRASKVVLLSPRKRERQREEKEREYHNRHSSR